MQKRKPEMPQIPDAMFKLALAFKKSRDNKKYEYYRKILSVKYPESNEAENIKNIT